MPKINGYPTIFLPNHPRANREGFVYEHIIVAEEILGRPLKKGEVVHHIDENRANNNKDNIVVFRSRSDHTAYHKTNRVYVLDETGIAYCPIRVSNICPVCGKPRDKKAKLCLSCLLDEKRSKFPPREILKEKIRNQSFLSIGREYQVTGNAVVRWCKFYNLPYTKKVINTISDEDWLNI